MVRTILTIIILVMSKVIKTTQSQQSNESGQNKDQSTGPSIDVFSDDFDQGYMKSASTSGYRGVYNGMTREEVEDKFGTSNGSVESLKWSYENMVI